MVVLRGRSLLLLLSEREDGCELELARDAEESVAAPEPASSAEARVWERCLLCVCVVPLSLVLRSELSDVARCLAADGALSLAAELERSMDCSRLLAEVDGRSEFSFRDEALPPELVAELVPGAAFAEPRFSAFDWCRCDWWRFVGEV